MEKGWKAQLELEFAKQGEKTLLVKRRQFGPLTVQRPFYPEGDVCHVYLLYPPGGIVGGGSLTFFNSSAGKCTCTYHNTCSGEVLSQFGRTGNPTG